MTFWPLGPVADTCPGVATCGPIEWAVWGVVSDDPDEELAELGACTGVRTVGCSGMGKPRTVGGAELTGGGAVFEMG